MGGRLKILALAIFVVAAILCVPSRAFAQTAAGRIIGTVSDPQGAAVAGAKVTVTNTATGVQWETTTNAEGAYQVLDLAIGTYKVTVEREGFAKAVTAAHELQINQSLRIDVPLKLGSTREVVEVTSEAVQVETVSPTIGETVTGATVQNLPLNGRNTLDLAFTMPGVTPAASLPGGETGGPLTEGLSVAGGRDDSVTYLLDGGDNTSVTYGTAVMKPNPDTVAEFRILTNNYTAEYGRSGGGVVSVVTKSGTNFFHGSIFDYLRNDAFNASPFFNNAHGVSRPVLKRNQFGGTIGGPIKKDRMFFFFGYQGQRETKVRVGNVLTVYTPAELNGDFSHSVNNGPDPGVVAFLQTHPYFVPSGGSASNGIIDPAKIDPVAQAYIALGLVPSAPGGSLVPNGRGTDDRDEYTAKVDFNATPKDQFTVTLTKFHNPVLLPFLLGLNAPNVPGFPDLMKFDNYFGTISYSRTFSQTALNEFHFTAQTAGNRLNIPGRKLPGPAALGVNIIPDDVTGPPQILLNVSGPQLGFNINGPAHYADTTYVYSDVFSWVRGRHNWKFGASLGIVQNNANFDFAVDGQFNFDGPAGIGTGNDRADFLVGAPDIFEQFPLGISAIRSHQYAVFAQDEWKVTPRLVLTLGVRYEYNSPKSDPKKRQYMIIPGLQSKRYPGAPLGMVFPGDPGAPDGITFPDRNDWAPRIGFAWDPRGNGKTSVRGGFGVFYDVLKGLDNQFQNGTPPFFAAGFLGYLPSNIPANARSPILADPYGTAGFPNPFPSSSLPPPSQLDFSMKGFIPIGPSGVFINPRMVTPYIYQYSLSVQQQLGAGMVAEVGYVGSSSHKLTTQIDHDPKNLATGNRVLNEQPGLQLFTGCGSIIAPQCPWGFTVGNDNGANANYNGLLASLSKRMGDWHSIGQTFFTLSYTWSHEIDDSNGMFRNTNQVPAYSHHQFHASGDSDVRNRVVLSGGWELPFAHLFSSAPKALTGGWTLYPIVFAQSGLPMDVTAGYSIFSSADPSNAGDPNLVKPNWAGGTPRSLDAHRVQTITIPGVLDASGNPIKLTGNFLFDPGALAVPNCYPTAFNPTPPRCPNLTYGTLPRNLFRGSRRVNFDLSLEKKTNLFKERAQLVFRAEFFNILNHTQFQNPPGGPQSVFSPQLGQAISTFDPRIGQLSLRFAF
jgi:outer membrane receptor protein involved in Fe transport